MKQILITKRKTSTAKGAKQTDKPANRYELKLPTKNENNVTLLRVKSSPAKRIIKE